MRPTLLAMAILFSVVTAMAQSEPTTAGGDLPGNTDRVDASLRAKQNPEVKKYAKQIEAAKLDPDKALTLASLLAKSRTKNKSSATLAFDGGTAELTPMQELLTIASAAKQLGLNAEEIVKARAKGGSVAEAFKVAAKKHNQTLPDEKLSKALHSGANSVQ